MKQSIVHNGENTLPDTAEAWMARLLAADCSEADRAAFESWRAADPAHNDDFAEIEYLHESAARLVDDPLIRAAAQAALRQKATPSRRWLGWTAAAAAVAIALGLAGWLHDTGTAPIHYASTTALQTIRLEDGTQMQLDAASAATVLFDRHRRVVKLDSGRAEFTVAPDGGRPFEVQADNAVIHDIGTRFQVSREAQKVTVGLLEGRVDVSGNYAGQAWHQSLAPAQQLQISPDGKAGAVGPLDVEAAKGWTSGLLVFHQRPLGDLLAEANRYSVLKLRLGDSSLASLRVSGSVHVGNQELLAKALERGWQLESTHTGVDEITLTRK